MMKDGKIDLETIDDHNLSLIVFCPECKKNHRVKIFVADIETEQLEE